MSFFLSDSEMRKIIQERCCTQKLTWNKWMNKSEKKEEERFEDDDFKPIALEIYLQHLSVFPVVSSYLLFSASLSFSTVAQLSTMLF